jgi:hypothetical protein
VVGLPTYTQLQDCIAELENKSNCRCNTKVTSAQSARQLDSLRDSIYTVLERAGPMENRDATFRELMAVVENTHRSQRQLEPEILRAKVGRLINRA